MLNLDVIYDRVRLATTGPWHAFIPESPNDPTCLVRTRRLGNTPPAHCWGTNRMDDASFMAAARQDVPALLDEVIMLRDILKTVLTDPDKITDRTWVNKTKSEVGLAPIRRKKPAVKVLSGEYATWPEIPSSPELKAPSL